jgi:signal transduction histidine kinase
MSGAIWGLGCIWLFQPDSSAVTLGMACLIAGLSGGVLSGIGVRARLYWLVCLPMGIGLIGAFLYHGSEVNPVLPIALLVLLITNGVFAHNIERHIGSAIQLRLENLALVGQLRERTHAAEQANLAKSKFLAGASHDLRQPVHALNLFLESLSTTRLDAKQETIVTHAKAASRASRELLDTLLDFSRIEAGVMQPKPALLPLAGLLRQLEDEFGPQADNKGLVYRSRDCLDHVYSDAALLLVILRNLVANAIRYTERGGVLVAVRVRGADRVIEVWDTGIGIAAIHHEDIFQDFHQIANQERDHRKGLGLGLAIVRRLVDALGMGLSLASRPGRGSVFSLRLPCASQLVQLAQAAAPDSPDRESSRGQPGPAALQPSLARLAGARPLQGLKVLLVDDEVLVLEGMRALLGEWGCAVQAFKDIDAAAQHVLACAGRGRPFDLLITDYRLENGVTGRDVIRAVSNALRMTHPDDFREPPSIIITGDTDPARIAQAQGVGATLLHKPIDTQVLYDELAKVWVLGRAPALSA